MREIKFRGKDKNGKWWYGDLIQTRPYADGRILTWIKPVDILGLGALSTPTECFHEVDPNTVGQSIGLKDRKRVEVYHNDILRVGRFWEGDGGDDPETWTEDSVQTVVWGGNEYPAFHMSPGLDDECNDFSSVLLRDEKIDMEIIGNVHDNPELMVK